MSFAFNRFIVLGGVVVLMMGCGGSGGGGTTGGGGGAGAGPTIVTFTFTGAAPTTVATQIGAEAFKAATASSGTVTLSIPEGTTQFALAANCPVLSQTSGAFTITSKYQVVLEGSTADGTSFTGHCPAAPTSPTTGALTGSVDASAIPGVDTVGVAAANSSSGGEMYFLSGTAPDLNLQMPVGTDRVAVGGYVYSASNPFGANTVYTLAAVRNFDGVTVPGSLNGGSIVQLGAGDAVTQQPITYKNVPSNYNAPSTFAYFLWKGGGGVWLSNGATTQYPSVPGAAAEAGDTYSFSATAYSQATSGEMVSVSTTSATGGPQELTFPTAWKYGGPASAALPTFDMTYAGFSGQSGVVNAAGISWQTGLGSGQPVEYLYQVLASANHQQGSTALAMPDLSGVPGFLPAPASGTDTVWVAEIIQGSNGFQQPATSVGNLQTVGNAGAYVVP